MGLRYPRRAVGVITLLIAIILTFWPRSTMSVTAGPNDPFDISPISGPPGTIINVTPNANTASQITNQGATLTPGTFLNVFYIGIAGVYDAHMQGQNYAVQQGGTLPAMQIQVPLTEQVGQQ